MDIDRITILPLPLSPSLFTSAEREVKHLRRSRMSQSCFFWDKTGHAKSVGFRFYLAIWRRESRISLRYLETTSICLIYSLTYSRMKEVLFWLSRGLNRLTCVTRGLLEMTSGLVNASFSLPGWQAVRINDFLCTLHTCSPFKQFEKLSRSWNNNYYLHQCVIIYETEFMFKL